MTQIEFFFDFGSPTAYLAWTQLPKIAAEYGAELVYRPVLLGAIHKATNNASPATIPAKSAWMNRDMARYAKGYGVRLSPNPYFPINTLFLMRGATGTQIQGDELFHHYVNVVYRAMWETPKNLGDQEVLRSTLREGGLAPDVIFELTQDPAVKEKLKADTEVAVARGLFGAPTIFVGEEMFFGQDRLHFVREALQTQSRPKKSVL
ncbi:2-hydroxychromene-2-carboxylate isomerase [Paraburkholderia sp. EG286B]|uniref:2-hydroxychromene-2-carboxylate isomerase n=1 Tax=Paraburkholderia sp. EG286B TaxID=3237011 RepID=UPI0034D26710